MIFDHTPLYLRSTKPQAQQQDIEEAKDAAFALYLPAAHRQLLSPELPTIADLTGYDHTLYVDRDDDNVECQNERQESWLLGFALPTDFESEQRSALPDLVRAASSDSESEDSDDDSSLPPRTKPSPKRKGVSFSSEVTVQPIPHASTLSLPQRRRMYATSREVRRNKSRNKKEFRYDGWDWRNATEEGRMRVDELTGELVHPAHAMGWAAALAA